MADIRFIAVDPAHFHAALVQKEMYDGVSPRCHVYAPLGGDLVAHLQRLAGFNARAENPTRWEVEVHTGPDFKERMLREKPGNVLVLAGRNAAKIDAIQAAVAAGLNVLADKPWILVSRDLAKLQAALDLADRQGLVAYDIMTERYEITSRLQRELVQDEAVFGKPEAGSEAEPAVYMESVHFLKKLVSGAPLRRPPAYFDIRQQGEGLNDVGTHLVDLVMWLLFPGRAIDAERDVRFLSAKRWPTVLSRHDFQEVTGEPDFPGSLTLKDGKLEFFCNNQVRYTVRGIHVRLDVLWNYESATGGGDTHLAVFRGSQARVEIRQGQEERYQPELYVIPRVAAMAGRVKSGLERKIALLQERYPGVALQDRNEGWRLSIPPDYRVGHEAHFGEVTKQFLRYLQKTEPMPAWEKPNMLAKYAITTRGVELAQ